MDGLEMKIQELERENSELRGNLGGKKMGGEDGEVDLERGESDLV